MYNLFKSQLYNLILSRFFTQLLFFLSISFYLSKMEINQNREVCKDRLEKQHQNGHLPNSEKNTAFPCPFSSVKAITLFIYYTSA